MIVRTDSARIVQPLMLAAGVLDLILVKAIVINVYEAVANETRISETVAFILCCIGIAVVYWAVTDLLLKGKSVGRMSFGLHPATSEGAAPSLGAFAKRAICRIATLGLTGLTYDKRAHYDQWAKIHWTAKVTLRDNTPPNKVDPTRWRLRVSGGPDAKQAVQIGRTRGFRRKKVLTIGRDPGCDLVLRNSPRVSRKHCCLRVRGRSVEIMDMQSTHGTMIHGGHLRPGRWQDVGSATHFIVDDVKIEIRR